MRARSVGIVAVIAAAILATAGLATADDGGRPFSTALSGANEVPALTDGVHEGSVALTLNQGQGEVCWQFGPITLPAGEELPFMGHIHEAPAGMNGDIVVTLFGMPGPAPAAPTEYPTDVVCQTGVDPELIKAIRQNPDAYYVNLHNSLHPGGVMRGQLGK